LAEAAEEAEAVAAEDTAGNRPYPHRQMSFGGHESLVAPAQPSLMKRASPTLSV